MNPYIVHAAQYIQWIIFLYFLAINSTYTLLIFFALKDIVQHAYLSTARSARRLLLSDSYYKPVSVIVPAFNEAAVISNSIRSLLNLHYPEFEIIVINDGSSDETIACLKKDFKLRAYTKPVRLQVPHAAIKDIYVSGDYPNLIVVDKENGGKADAINAGVNVSSYPLFCSIDADSLLEPDAILKSSKLFIEDDELIATGGIVRVINGCKVKDGAVFDIALPEKNLEAIQVLEYTRAFLSGRTGWNLLKSLLIISGAFGVFRKDMVLAVNGYRKTVGEDMDLVMRLHRHCLDKNIPYKIFFVPDPVCWTQVPFSLKMLLKHSNRLHRGLIDCLRNNRAMILNPKYGKVSLLGVSYFVFVEILGPIIELLGYISIPILYIMGLLNTKFMLLFVTVAILWGISINISTIFLDTYNFRRYKKEKDILRLCFLSVIEFLGYRQITLLERMRATFSFRETGWGTQKRQAHHDTNTLAAVIPEEEEIPYFSEFFRRPGVLRVGEAASGFLSRLPVLLLAMLCLRAAELASGLETGAALPEIAGAAASALGQDLIGLARYLPAIFLCSLPFLLIRSRRAGFWSLGLAWSLLLFVQASLAQYFLTARVPLGADLLAYTWADILTTTRGGLPVNIPVLTGLVFAFAAFWTLLALQGQKSRQALPPQAAAALLALSLVVMVAAPRRTAYAGSGTEYMYDLTLNKAVYFFDDIAAYLAPARPGKGRGPAAAPGSTPAASGFHYLDPKYPFLHSEQTPDALGPYFQIRADKPPNLVFIIIEGLGRSFSGPGALLGSFTPKLDQLAANSLYWENFLAVQGRTFGVLPSIFASLPFAANGFADLGRMPAHVSLLSVLTRQNYRLKCYVGFDMNFDNDRLFFTRQGATTLVDEKDFGPGYKRSNVWGYADNDLISRVLEGEALDAKEPFVSVVKTTTMHTPYTFNGQADYYPHFEQRLDQLGIAEAQKPAYREYRHIYTSTLYADDAVNRFLEEMKKHPAYQNTIFIITGDHRLPEIPMANRIDRYHVPLIVFSPLLKAPARIKSVSSQFDIAPSLLAFLSHNYGIQTPQAVTWLGSGLDMEPSFRNIHDIPIKQTKTNLVDYVSGTWFLNQDTLYKLSDGMAIEPAGDAGTQARLHGQFAQFIAANDQFSRSLALIPEGTENRSGPYREEERKKLSAAEQEGTAGLSVREVRVPEEARPGSLVIEAVFANTGKTETGSFVPLVILLTADGRELSESYSPRQRLAAGETVTLQLTVNSGDIAPGRYFLTVLPSDPGTGRSMGDGRHRIPVLLHN